MKVQKTKKQHNSDLSQFLKVDLRLPFPREKRRGGGGGVGGGWGGGGGGGGGGGWCGVGWGNWVFSFLKDKLIPLKLIASKSCVLLIKIHVVSKIS